MIAHALRGEEFDASEDGTGRGTPLVAVAFGGNDTSGPIDVATARNAHSGPHGRLDFESETFLVEPLAFSCKDHGADAGDVSPTLRAMGHADSHANAGGQVAIAFHARQDPDSGPVTHPLDTHRYSIGVAFDGQNLADCGETSATLDTGGARSNRGMHLAAAFVQNGRSEVRLAGGDGQITGALRASTGSQQQYYVTSTGMSVRRLLPVECLRLQGFPDDYLDGPQLRGRPLADGPRYRLIGNSWCVPVVAWLFRRMTAELTEGDE